MIPLRLPLTHTRQIGRVLFAALFSMALAVPAGAQRGRNTTEFTKQGVLITDFAAGAGADVRLGRRAADAVRSRLGKLVNKRETEVVDGGEIRYQLERAGYRTDGPVDVPTVRSLGRHFRADEYLLGTVANGPGGVRLRADLVLFRDDRLRQPLAEVTAAKLDDAAEQMAQAINAARTQLVYQRRCENGLRTGKNDAAVAAAREGVAAFARSTIARTCLLWSLRSTRAPLTEVLEVAREVLAIDSMSFHAIESAALALDSLHRAPEAAPYWLRLAQTDTSDLELATRVLFSLLDGGSSKPAEPFAIQVSDAHPDHIPLLQQKWRATYTNKNWPRAIESGEALLIKDAVAAGDSAFYLRLATAYKAYERPYQAIEILARGVSKFPGDAKLYTLYTQYIKAEADTVVPRGLALFPKSPELLALSAKELRSRGKLQESLDATRAAVALDSTLSQADLTVAQMEIDLGRPDSALVSLHRALTHGEDSALVAGFALSKGNTLYRAANGTRSSADFTLALRYLAFADSVKPSSQSHFLMGAAALGVAQSALTEAPKLTDKMESCRLARLGGDMVPVARAGLQAGQDVLPDAAKQSLEYLDQLNPYVSQQITAFCGAP
jgi:tetratricopeptide (TPR) repeat protein